MMNEIINYKNTNGNCKIINRNVCKMINGNCKMINGNCKMINGNCKILNGNCKMINGNCKMVNRNYRYQNKGLSHVTSSKADVRNVATCRRGNGQVVKTFGSESSDPGSNDGLIDNIIPRHT